jgi:hypothetical protein
VGEIHDQWTLPRLVKPLLRLFVLGAGVLRPVPEFAKQLVIAEPSSLFVPVTRATPRSRRAFLTRPAVEVFEG